MDRAEIAVMLYFFRLCWKNVWRSRRRTLLTVSAIGIGVMALVAVHNYYDSFHEQIIENVTRYQSGHLMIARRGYLKDRPPSVVMNDSSRVVSHLDGAPNVIGISRRVIAPGLLSSPRGSANVAFIGIEPDRERKVTRYFTNTTEGTYFESDLANAIFIGKSLQALLQVKVGEKLVALTQGVDGSIGNELLVVCGVYETGSEHDKSTVFIRIEKARDLLGIERDSAHQIAVMLTKDDVTESFKREISHAFPELEVLGWREIQKHVVAIIDLDRAVNRLLLGIILMVAAMGITNTILMSILERTREFGIMMAIGTRTRELVGMIVGETTLLCGIGVVIGNVLGAAITLFFGRTGFDLKWLTSQDFAIDGTVVNTISYPSLSIANSLNVSGAILILSLLISIFPIRQLGRLDAVKALRG